MGDKEIAIDLSELNRVEVYCPKSGCGVGIVITMPNSSTLDVCPSCHTAFSDHVKTALVAYHRFFQNAVDSSVKFRFRIKAQ